MKETTSPFKFILHKLQEKKIIILIFLGSLGLGGGLLFLCIPRAYLTPLLISVDMSSLPAIIEPEKVVKTFTSAIMSPDLCLQFMQKLTQNSPEFAKKLKSKNMTLEQIVLKQIGSLDFVDYLPIKIIQGKGQYDYILTLAFPVFGLKDNLFKSLVEALNSLSAEYNKRVLYTKAVQEKETLNHAHKIKKLIEGTHFETISQKQEEVATIRATVSQLEYRFLEKITQKQDRDFIYIKDDEKQGDENQENKIFARIYRILGILKEKGKIKDSEFTELQQTLNSLENKDSVNRYQALMTYLDMKTVSESLKEALKEAVTPVNRTALFLPSFQIHPHVMEHQQRFNLIEIEKSYLLPLFILWVIAVSGVLILAQRFMANLKNNRKQEV